MLLAIFLTMFLGLLGVMAGTLMTNSLNLFIAALVMAVIFVTTLAVALEAAAAAPEQREDAR
jgi:hypothetical protein